jgi:hypothetical protein
MAIIRQRSAMTLLDAQLTSPALSNRLVDIYEFKRLLMPILIDSAQQNRPLLSTVQPRLNKSIHFAAFENKIVLYILVCKVVKRAAIQLAATV